MAEHGVTKSPQTTTSINTFRYTIEHHRKDGISREDFFHWLIDVHVPLAFPIMKRHNIIKFAVHKTDLEVAAGFQELVDTVRPGWKVSDSDVILEYWTQDLDNIKSLSSDPEWVGGAAKDQDAWVDTSRSTIHIGHDTTYLEDGAILNVVQR